MQRRWIACLEERTAHLHARSADISRPRARCFFLSRPESDSGAGSDRKLDFQGDRIREGFKEATAIGVLYRTVENYPEPHRTKLTDQLRVYKRDEIDQAWPLQRKGLSAQAVGTASIKTFSAYLTHIEPQSEGQKALHSEALRQFSNMIESRRERLASVSTQLPPSSGVSSSAAQC